MKTAKDYYELGMQTIREASTRAQKPSLLLHSCCGPCNAYPIELLAPVFALTLYFNNSNIYPQEEYLQRLTELEKYVAFYNQTYSHDVKMIITNYDNVSFTNYLSPRKEDKEGQGRCFMCYEKRMDEAYCYAHAHQFDYVTTVMSISRQKSVLKLNEIGESLQQNYPNTTYLYSNFKKNKGIDRGVELSKQHQMYHQDYCGCVYSYLERQRKKEEIL